MKKFRMLFLVALIPFMMISCKKAEPNLRAVFNLQGPVETCQCECANVTFDENALTMTYESLFGEPLWTTRTSHRQISLLSGSDETLHKITFNYDNNGRLEEVIDHNKATNTEVVTKYKYEKDELLPNFKSVNGGAKEKQQGGITYGAIDRFGNWTTATWNGTTYNRTLTYFAVPEGAEVASNCPTDVSFDKDLFLEIIIGILILIAAIVMIVHMLLVIFKGKVRTDYSVNDFVAKRIAEGRSQNSLESENQRAWEVLQDALNSWKTIMVDGDEVQIPGSGSVVRKSYAAIKEVDAIAPTDQDLVEALNAFGETLNTSMEREFTGSKLFLIIASIIAVLFAFMTPKSLVFFGGGVVVYFLASRKTSWMILKEYSKGGNKSNFLSGVLGGLLGGVAAAKTVRTVTKWDDGTTTVDDDHSQTWFALIFLLIGCVILACVSWIVAFINYLRNYVIYW